MMSRYLKVLLAVSSTVSMIGSSPSAVQAREYTWDSALNLNAKNIALNTQILTMRYPVMGDAVPTAGTNPGGPSALGIDGFCVQRPPGTAGDYPNAQCISGRGHAGADIIPATNKVATEYQVVAAVAGTVVREGCVDGSGWRIVVSGTDGRFYHYYHLSYSYVNDLDVVAVGQHLGQMGATSYSDCGNGTSYHLHFEVHQSGDTRATHSIDPFRSLRYTYAYLGRDSNGTLYQPTFTAAWDRYANAHLWIWPSHYLQMTYIGWPVRASGGPNIQAKTSSFGSTGTIQYLSSQTDWYSPDRLAGVIVRHSGSAYAYLVPNAIFAAYRANGLHSGYLGFPTTDYLPSQTKQYFQGGCIAHNGSAFVAARYGTWPC